MGSGSLIRAWAGGWTVFWLLGALLNAVDMTASAASGNGWWAVEHTVGVFGLAAMAYLARPVRALPVSLSVLGKEQQ